jgi:hypothetical protein
VWPAAPRTGLLSAGFKAPHPALCRGAGSTCPRAHGPARRAAGEGKAGPGAPPGVAARHDAPAGARGPRDWRRATGLGVRRAALLRRPRHQHARQQRGGIGGCAGPTSCCPTASCPSTETHTLSPPCPHGRRRPPPRSRPAPAGAPTARSRRSWVAPAASCCASWCATTSGTVPLRCPRFCPAGAARTPSHACCSAAGCRAACRPLVRQGEGMGWDSLQRATQGLTVGCRATPHARTPLPPLPPQAAGRGWSWTSRRRRAAPALVVPRRAPAAAGRQQAAAASTPRATSTSAPSSM